MEAESSDLLSRAASAYRDVDADPSGFGPEAARLVVEARTAGHVEALVSALRAEAWAHRSQRSNTRAKALLDEAARLARKHDLPERLGDVLTTRAAVNLELGRERAAEHDLAAAAALVTGESARHRDLQLAILHHNIGRLTAAAGIYRALLTRPDVPLVVQGKAANNLAHIEAQQGSYRAALRSLDAAAAATTNPVMAAGVTLSRGWVTVQAGMLPEGLRLFDEAARLFQAAGLPLDELYTESADALGDLRLLPEASAAAVRAAAECESHGVPLMGADAQLRVARLARLSGDLQGSVAAAERAVCMFRQQRRPAWVARAVLVGIEVRVQAGEVGAPDLRAARRAATTLDRLGARPEAVHAHLTAGRVAAALDRGRHARQSLSRAAGLAAAGTPVLVRLDGHVAAALCARLQGVDREVLRHCRAGLRDLFRYRAALPSMELRALASGHGAELGRLGLQISLQSGSPLRVLDWMERTRAAALSTVERPAADGLEEEFGALRAVHAELAEAVAGSTADPAGTVPALDRDSPAERPGTSLLSRQREIEARIRRATWVRGGAADTDSQPSSPAGVRAALAGRFLVEYGVLAGQLFAVVLAARRSRLVDLGAVAAVEAQAQSLMFALRRLTRPRRGAALAAARTSAEFGLGRLTSLLLAPLHLDPDSSLVVVPARGLHRLPWAALHGGPVALAPSAAFWVRTSTATSDSGGPTVLVAGPDLSGAVREIEAVRRLYPNPVVLVPPQSTGSVVAKAIVGAALAHLACHGDLRADNPTFSALRMSDGPLTLHELDSRGAAPRRIVLASCESGAQVEYVGDEVVGFISALMARGTAGLVASTVVVSDAETVDLMCALHQALRAGATLADALYGARQTVDRDDPRAFVSWCAFNAYGAA